MQIAGLKKYRTPILNKIITALDGKVMFVGGVVRDIILGRETKDIDLVTEITPDEVLKRLKQSGLKPLEIGKDFGMVAVVETDSGFSFEITTLREDVIPLGRRAIVKFGKDYQLDAIRRDFTINANYADMEGNLIDFLGEERAFNAVKNKEVLFIGDAETRIKEDALRIFRYFRFFANYGGEKPDESALNAIHNNLSLIEKISVERVIEEIYKILQAKDKARVVKTFSLMKKVGLLDYMGFGNYKKLEQVLVRQELYGISVDKYTLFASLFTVAAVKAYTTPSLKKRFHLSNIQIEKLDEMCLYPQIIKIVRVKPRLAVYLYGKAKVQNACLFARKAVKNTFLKEILTLIVPQFPLNGSDVAELGLKGEEIGRFLKQRQKVWIKSDFTLNKKQLLEQRCKKS